MAGFSTRHFVFYPGKYVVSDPNHIGSTKRESFTSDCSVSVSQFIRIMRQELPQLSADFSHKLLQLSW